MVVPNKKILIAEKDKLLRQVLEKKLTILGYKIYLSATVTETFFLLKEKSPDLLILDFQLSRLPGHYVCQKIREESQVPIILLDSFRNISDCVVGLEIGADDYISKPFSQRELEARIGAILKRATNEKVYSYKKPPNTIYIGGLTIDFNNPYILRNNKALQLTNIEFIILKLLLKNAGKGLNRKTILDNIWGYTPTINGDNRVIDVYISRLRSKIEDNPRHPKLIITVRGKGYMFKKY